MRLEGRDDGPVLVVDAHWAVIEPFMPKNQPGRAVWMIGGRFT